LSAVAQAYILVLEQPPPIAFSSALRASGATIVEAGDATLIAASRAMFEGVTVANAAERGLRDELLEAIRLAESRPSALHLRGRHIDLDDEAAIMGIINVTPDSFYDRVASIDGAIKKAEAMVSDGAKLIDVGGQSYAHWNARVTAEEEKVRVVSVVAAIAAAGIDAAISVDTFRASVATAVLDAGAHLINDCSGLSDPAVAEAVAARGAGLVIMHIKGTLNERDPNAYRYNDVLAEIIEFLYQKTQRALALGVAHDAIVVDPGLEFGKEPASDLEILERFGELRALGYPILLAASRKSFMGRVFGRAAGELLVPSLGAAALGIFAGARVLRVHDVPETVQLARMLALTTPRVRRSLSIPDQMPGTPATAESRGTQTL
jgi:dihydropteroate synthase